ncbi:MAG: hypothetical protein RLZZ618_1908 [Pseudomonadota bacterium]|jgi:hypothetical protein
MDKMLQRLETFTARGTDGKVYSVHAFEHLCRMDVFSAGQSPWESTGLAEYHLQDGHPVKAEADGSFSVVGSGLRLKRETTHH